MSGSEDIEAAVNVLLDARGLGVLDDEDAQWIVVLGLVTGAIQLAPYDLAWFLGRLLEPPHPDWDLISSFLADVDYIDDGYVDVATVERDITETFSQVRPELQMKARSRFAANPDTRWVLDALDAA